MREEVKQGNSTNHKMRTRLWLAIGLTLASLLLIALWLLRQYEKYPRAYAGLKPGASKAEVLVSFGMPGDITACSAVPTWDGNPLDSSVRCVREFRYFSRLRIGEWTVGFDASDRVITKGYSSSP
jgi:hypothetical protein